MVIVHEARVNADTCVFRTSSAELHYLCNTGALRNRQSRIHLGKSVERAMFPGVLCLCHRSLSTVYPAFDNDDTIIDLPVDCSDTRILGFLKPFVTPTRLNEEARRADLVLKYVRHVAVFGVVIDLPNDAKARERLDYLHRCTCTLKDIKWWIENVFVPGAPDSLGRHPWQ